VKLDSADGIDLTEVQGEIWEDGQGNSWVGGDQTTQVVVPGALKYLDVELAAMGVKLKYRITRDDEPRKGPLKPLAWNGVNGK
jgi:DNA-directed RNA polymerase I subunit RPA2